MNVIRESIEGKSADYKSGFIPDEVYTTIHASHVIPCHDAIIKYRNGILAVTRKGIPMLNWIWCLGGRVERGVPLEQSLQKKVFNECGLTLKNLRYVCADRTIMGADPFNHNCGTDTFNIVYHADGEGDLNLDSNHQTPTIITPEMYEKLKSKIHPRFRNHIEFIFNMAGFPPAYEEFLIANDNQFTGNLRDLTHLRNCISDLEQYANITTQVKIFGNSGLTVYDMQKGTPLNTQFEGYKFKGIERRAFKTQEHTIDQIGPIIE